MPLEEPHWSVAKSMKHLQFTKLYQKLNNNETHGKKRKVTANAAVSICILYISKKTPRDVFGTEHKVIK